MANPNPKTEHLEATKFTSENQPEKKGGRPKGRRNRSTIAKYVMSLGVKPPKQVVEKLKELYPEMENEFTSEEIAAMQLAQKAMKGDVRAYQVLMEMAYEPHKQKIEQHNLTVDDVLDEIDNPNQEKADETTQS